MTDTEKAIAHFENVAADYYNRLDDEGNQEVYYMCGVALSALHAQQERENGCEYCNGRKAEIAHTHTTKLKMNTFGKARTLVTECDPCPPYSDCCMKHIPANSAFIIKFCPMCGRKLDMPKEAE